MININILCLCSGCVLLPRPQALHQQRARGEGLLHQERKDAVAQVQIASTGVMSDHKRPLPRWTAHPVPDHAGTSLSPSHPRRALYLTTKPTNHLSNQVSHTKI
jgi:hypothetical protein